MAKRKMMDDHDGKDRDMMPKKKGSKRGKGKRGGCKR